MKIEKIKKTGSKYTLTLDNGQKIITYDNVILKNNLLFSKKIDEKDLNKILEDTNYYQMYNKVVNLISQRLRSEKEIREYLTKNSVLKKEQNKIIQELKKIDLINDYKYAKAYTNDKINLSLDGPYKIQKHLEKNKIDQDIIIKVINEINQTTIDEHLKKIISKKTNTTIKKSEYAFKQKLTQYLINQGYSSSDIKKHLENIHIKPSGDEMEKIYNKLQKKYDGEKLIYNLKNKLYAKGYKIEDINNFINQKL